jgi:hypothetical protein
MRNQLLSELNKNNLDNGVRGIIEETQRKNKADRKREAFEEHRKKMLKKAQNYSKESDRRNCTFTPRIKKYRPPSRPKTPTQREISIESSESRKSNKLTLEDLAQVPYSPYKADSPTKHKLMLNRSQKSAKSLYNFDVDDRSVHDLQEWHELKSARGFEKKLKKLGMIFALKF